MNATILGHKGNSRSVVSRTIDDVGIPLNLFTASVAEVFALLLDIINPQRLEHARMVMVACKRGDGLTESEHTTVLIYWETLVGCRKIVSEKE